MRRSNVLVILTLTAVLCLCGCGSGTWHDDARNWKRATGQKVPEGVTVVHSVYWRTPHFTREDGWTFQLKVTDAYKKVLFEHYKLKNPKPEEMWKITSMKASRPSWFLPKPLNEYEIWILANEPDASFALFIDKQSGEIFITDGG